MTDTMDWMTQGEPATRPTVSYFAFHERTSIALSTQEEKYVDQCRAADCIRLTMHELCFEHSEQQRETGSLMQLHRPSAGSLLERFASRIEPDEYGCWLWTGGKTERQYPMFYVSPPQLKVRAHRWSFSQFVGDIGSGLEIDHTCNVRRCVRPGHLQPLTRTEHQRVGMERRSFMAMTGASRIYAPDRTWTLEERAFGLAHQLPVAPIQSLRFRGASITAEQLPLR